MTDQELSTLSSFAYDRIVEIADEAYNIYWSGRDVYEHVEKGNLIYTLVRVLGRKDSLTIKQVRSLEGLLRILIRQEELPLSSLYGIPDIIQYKTKYLSLEPLQITDTPVDDSDIAISAKWAYNHINATNPHGVRFLQLLDVTESTFTGNELEYVRVNAAGTGLEFSAVTIPSSSEIAGNPTNTNVQNPSVSEDGYVISWDNDAGEYVLVPDQIGNPSTAYWPLSGLASLTGNVTIDLNNYLLGIASSLTGKRSALAAADQGIGLNWSLEAGTSDIYYFSTGDNAAGIFEPHTVLKRLTIGGVASHIGIFGDRLEIRDSIGSKGVVYHADYTANYTNLSITHKGYQDSHIGGKSVNSNITAPNISHDGYLVSWDNTSSQYKLVAPTDLLNISDKQILFSDSGVISGSDDFTWNNSAKNLKAINDATIAVGTSWSFMQNESGVANLGADNSAVIAGFGSVAGDGSTIYSGASSFTFGTDNRNYGTYSFVGGFGAMVDASGAGGYPRGGFAYGMYTADTGGLKPSTIPYVRAAGGAVNISRNTSAQTDGNGALAPDSVILGGINHSIPSSSLRSAVIGGSGIVVGPSVLDTVHMPNLRIFRGVTEPQDNSLTRVLVYHSPTGQVKYRDVSTIIASNVWKTDSDTTLSGTHTVFAPIDTRWRIGHYIESPSIRKSFIEFNTFESAGYAYLNLYAEWGASRSGFAIANSGSASDYSVAYGLFRYGSIEPFTNDRDITDKAYQDSHIGGNDVNTNVLSPGVGQDGYFMSWDNANSEYVLVAGSGASYTFNSGVTESGGIVVLGGTLLNNTSIDGNSLYSLTVQNLGAGGFLVNDTGGTGAYIVSDSLVLRNAINDIGIDISDTELALYFGNNAITLNTSDQIFIEDILPNDNALEQVIVRDNVTGQLKYRTASSISGSANVGGSDTQIQYNDAGAFNGANLYYNKATGDFGIGAASDGTRVFVRDTVANLITLHRDSNIVGSNAQLSFAHDDSSNALVATGSIATAMSDNTAASVDSYMRFYTYVASSAVEGMRLLNNSLKIGAASNPSYNLDVTGTGYISGAFKVGGLLTLDATPNNGDGSDFILSRDSVSGEVTKLAIGTNLSVSGGILSATGGGAIGNFEDLLDVPAYTGNALKLPQINSSEDGVQYLDINDLPLSSPAAVAPNAPSPILFSDLTTSDFVTTTHNFRFVSVFTQNPVNKRIVNVYRRATGHLTDGDMVMIRSATGGGDWEKDGSGKVIETVITTNDEAIYSGNDLRNFCGGYTKNGRLIIGYVDYDSNTDTFYDMYTIYSDDDGDTWSDPYSMPVVAGNTRWSPFGRIVEKWDHELQSNCLYQTFNMRTTGGGLSDWHNLYIWRSIDNGATWLSANILNVIHNGVLGGTATTPTHDTYSSSALEVGHQRQNEPFMVHLGGDYLLLIARPYNYFDTDYSGGYQYLSRDGGQTWEFQGRTIFDMGTKDWDTEGSGIPADRYSSPLTIDYIEYGGVGFVLTQVMNREIGTWYHILGRADDIVNNGVDGWDLATYTIVKDDFVTMSDVPTPSYNPAHGYGGAVFFSNRLKGMMMTWEVISSTTQIPLFRWIDEEEMVFHVDRKMGRGARWPKPIILSDSSTITIDCKFATEVHATIPSLTQSTTITLENYTTSSTINIHINKATPSNIIVGLEGAGLTLRGSDDMQLEASGGELPAFVGASGSKWEISVHITDEQTGGAGNTLVASFESSDASGEMFAFPFRSQSFQPTEAGELDRIELFLVQGSAVPTGNAVVKIYTISGTYGSSGKPDIAGVSPAGLLATSDLVDVSTAVPASGSPAFVPFSFTGSERINISDLTQYVMVLEYTNSVSSTQTIRWYYNTVDGYSGNRGWTAVNPPTSAADFSANSTDMLFRVYTDSGEVENVANVILSPNFT